MNEGKVYFKVNGKVLRDSNGRILYASVSDGSAVLEDFNNTNTWDEETSIEAVYVGNKNFTTSHSDIVSPSIIEGNESGGDTPAGPSISVESVSGSAGETVTITVNVDNVDGGKVVLKVNGKTVKAVDGKIYAKVENGVATFTYTIPKTYKTGEYSVKAVYTEGSCKLECDSTLTVA
ncbi:MAG: hypothetical protein BZ136_04645 [Methanosphaera sp. rholeuAM74]|nr:MAG: hypothetical protein BZ136_04645 [Methanosphaera sp. rholeuAM74]